MRNQNAEFESEGISRADPLSIRSRSWHFPLQLRGFALNVCSPDALSPTNTFEPGILHSTLKIRHLLRFPRQVRHGGLTPPQNPFAGDSN
jgi:hypothetical protein